MSEANKDQLVLVGIANYTSGKRWEVERNGHRKQWTYRSGATPEIARSFIKCGEPINTMVKAARMKLCRERLELLDARAHLNISADEHWKALNLLLTQVGRSRVRILEHTLNL